MELVPVRKRFSWAALEKSADPRYWEIGWELVRRQLKRIHEDVPPGAPNDPRGTEAILEAPKLSSSPITRLAAKTT